MTEDFDAFLVWSVLSLYETTLLVTINLRKKKVIKEMTHMRTIKSFAEKLFKVIILQITDVSIWL